MSILTKIFGDANQKIIDQLQNKVDEINKLESKFKKFSNGDFLKQTKKWQTELKDKSFNDQQKMLDKILAQAFAMVREAAKRTLAQRHYDVQLIAGMVLHQGDIAEMRTGEGKTLAATVAVYLNALTGRGAHVITVNDYLARRDTVWMGQIYNKLGLTVGCLNHEQAYLYDESYQKETRNNVKLRGNNVALRKKQETKDANGESSKDYKTEQHGSSQGTGANNLDTSGEQKEDIAELDEERDELGAFKVVDEFLKPVQRKQAYAADITYGTNNEFGFDYLRDNMVQDLNQKVQIRGTTRNLKESRNNAEKSGVEDGRLHFAIVDEVDSILIDEARTPLIISAPDTSPTNKYVQFAQLVARLKENEDYNIDEKMRAATLTEQGIKKMEEWLGVDNIYTDRGMRDVHHIEQALKAQVLFKKDKDYVIKDGEVVIVDEFTGRMMFGRRYSEGLHQAIEAKEGVNIKQESITMATITFQNYFRMYKKLAGMTGTAATEAEEFSKIYELEVIIIPTNKPMIRNDKADIIFKTEKEKYDAIVQEIKGKNQKGQPVLVGTISIEHNEHLSELLQREGVEHKVLNAKQHEQEGEIIAQAGHKAGVTIATNMAGRGVDIVLGGNPPDDQEQQEVLKLGGLHVIGTERHESRRIDNQLRGRAGRQGDPGSSQFFVSMEDDLMRIFGGERMKSLMQSLGVPDGMPIKNKMISNQIEKAQYKVEGHNFDIRKHLVEYDDVINKHREVVYRMRNKILSSDKIQDTRYKIQKNSNNQLPNSKKHANIKEMILGYIQQEITGVVNFHTQSPDESEWNLEEIYETINTIFSVPLEVRVNIEEIKEKKQETRNKKQGLESGGFRGELSSYLYGLAEAEYKKLEDRINNDENLKSQLKTDDKPMSVIERMVMLRAIDMLWVEHIDAIDHMRQGIGLRGYGQKDPLVEYKKEAHRMFQELLANIRKQVVYSIFKIGVGPVKQEPSAITSPLAEASRRGRQGDQRSNFNFSGPAKTGVVSSTMTSTKGGKKKVGRNDPCPCGSGKKYKKCCGA